MIAEAGTAHAGDVEAACFLVQTAVNAGCDVIKFQAFDDPEGMMFCWIDGDKERCKRWEKSRIGYEGWSKVKDFADAHGIKLMFSCFENTTIGWAEGLRLPCMKVASRAAASFPWGLWNGPFIVSDGMWRPNAQEVARLPKKVVMMQCTAEYPAEVPWRGYSPGYSAHSKDPFLAIDAIRNGAAFVEVHFQVDDYDAGPDEPVSLYPFELVTVCEARDYYYKNSY